MVKGSDWKEYEGCDFRGVTRGQLDLKERLTKCPAWSKMVPVLTGECSSAPFHSLLIVTVLESCSSSKMFQLQPEDAL